jgi:hypothetical protein
VASNGIRSAINFVRKDEVAQKLKVEMQMHIDTDIHIQHGDPVGLLSFLIKGIRLKLDIFHYH